MSGDRVNLDRRQFLVGAAASAWLAATHGTEAGSASGPAAASPGGAGRIRGLRLHTAASPAAMRDFYGGLLGLGIAAENGGEVTIQAGETPVTFVTTGVSEGGEPFYHFAFNIPRNKLLAARDWQLRRTPLIPPPEGLRDPELPADVVHFRNWNAHSVFFWDPGGNLVEYIARHDLASSATGPFGSSDILYASEIGLVADDVPALAADLRKTFGLPVYRRGSEQFTPVGDELGLLLVMKRGRILGFGEGRPAGVFATEAAVRGEVTGAYSAPGLPYRVTAA